MGFRPSRDIVLIPFETRIKEVRNMKLDRNLQHRILTTLSGIYPRTPSADDLNELSNGVNDHAFEANLFYLTQHGLIENCLDLAKYGQAVITLDKLVCTAKGMDFLADDGGLSATLGTVTVKLHEDTLRQLIEAKVQASNLPEEQKSGILKALREAPGETTKTLITKLVDLGMENAAKAIPLIQTLLQGVHS